MTNTGKLHLVALAVAIAYCASALSQRISEIPSTQVRLSDQFWAPRIEVNRTDSIPQASEECEQGAPTVYCETCAVIANVHRNYRMFLATGESKYIDVCERALYNNEVVSSVPSLAASVPGYAYAVREGSESSESSEDSETSETSENSENSENSETSESSESSESSEKSELSPTIFVNLYLQSKVTVGKVELEQITDYPWDGKIRIRINKGGGWFVLKLRVPGWLKQHSAAILPHTYADRARPYSIKVNKRSFYPETRDYITLKRRWKKGDVIELDLPMDVRRIKANDNDEDLRGKVALERGPIVFCLEGKYQADHHVSNKFILPSAPITAHFEADLLGGIMMLEGEAWQVEQSGEVSKTTFRAIPYAASNHRGHDQMEVWVADNPTTASAASVGDD